MNWNATARQAHRWMSIAFLAIVATVSAIAAIQDEPAEWVFFTPLPPLFVLMTTGAYLFALPHVQRWRRRASTG